MHDSFEEDIKRFIFVFEKIPCDFFSQKYSNFFRKLRVLLNAAYLKNGGGSEKISRGWKVALDHDGPAIIISEFFFEIFFFLLFQ